MVKICTNSTTGGIYCPGWYYFVLPSLCIYTGVLCLLVVVNIIGRLFCGDGLLKLTQRCTAGSLHDFAYGHSSAGNKFTIFIFLLSMVSFWFYLLQVNAESVTEYITYRVTSNATWKPTAILYTDMVLNSIFCFHFILRLVAASDKLLFWLTWNTVVDIASIPSFASYLMFQQYWSCLRFFRAMYLLSVPDILQVLSLIKDARALRLFRIFFAFLTLWLVSAGFVHMFENNGDPWLDYFNGQPLSYFGCIYFLIITSSTIGYGDVTCRTTLGKVFDVGFIFFALGMFASILPQAVSLLQLVSPYNGRLRLPANRHHVLVIGHITGESALKFVKAFTPGCSNKHLAVVFLHHKFPCVQLENLLKRKSNLYYYRGNDMDMADLNRVNLTQAEACVILANQHAVNLEEQDSSNIMRAVAVKNVSSGTRVVIQLLRAQMKAHLLNIPSWNAADAAVCLDEVKMGALGQNCCAPGFTTLLSLLLTNNKKRTHTNMQKSDENDLEKVYTRGSNFKFHASSLSTELSGLSFSHVAELCFRRFNLVLVAVKPCQTSPSQAATHAVLINPGKSYTVRDGDQAFFIALSAEAAKKASSYCRKHLDQCQCKNSNEREIEAVFSNNNFSVGNAVQMERGAEKCEEDVNCQALDSTGMFHWQPEVAMSEVSLTLRSAAEKGFKNHVVLCIFGHEQSPPIGLKSLVMPLRSSNHSRADLKPIVLLGNRRYIEHEWHYIHSFPEIYMLSGSAMDRAMLRAVNVNDCDMCVILAAQDDDQNVIMADKYSILCYLNVKSTKSAPNASGKHNSNPQKTLACSPTQSLESVIASSPSSINTPTSTANLIVDTVTDTAAFSCKHNINESPSPNCIPVVVSIAHRENILVLDANKKHNKQTSLAKMQPFESGEVFTGELLDSMTSLAYFCPDELTLVRELVTGGSAPDTDQLLADGLDGASTCTARKNRVRVRVSHFALQDAAYSHLLIRSNRYADLFLATLELFGFVCVGVSRLRGLATSQLRVILVCPPDDFLVQPSDKVICLKPSDEQ